MQPQIPGASLSSNSTGKVLSFWLTSFTSVQK